MATKDTKRTDEQTAEARKVADAAKDAEAPEAPDEVEAGEQTGMKALVEDLHERREKAKLGGGEEKIALQHERGKLTARERIDLLVDPGTFVEIGIHGGPHFSQRSMEGKEAPADGVITGWGDVDGRTLLHRRLRLHGDGRLDGDDRRAQGRPPARDGAAEADAARSGCSTRPARGSRRRPARCSPARATCSARR